MCEKGKTSIKELMWGHDVHELNTDVCEHAYGSCDGEECELLC